MTEWQDLSRYDYSGAYDELGRDGRAGDRTRTVLDLAVLNIGERRGFVPPGPHQVWTYREASRVAVYHYGAGRTGFLVGCWARAHDDDSLLAVVIDELEATMEAAASDWSVEQVADETGSPTGTVKARLSRGRAALAVLLSEGDPRA